MNMAGLFERFMEDDLEAYGIRNHPSVHSYISL